MTTLTRQALAALGLPEQAVAVAAVPGCKAYLDSLACRSDAKSLPQTVALIVVNRASQAAVAPINLAAALCQDNPRRDVYLWEDQPSGSLVSRARAAGIRGVIDSVQMRQLLEPEEVYELEALELDEPKDNPQAWAAPAAQPAAPKPALQPAASQPVAAPSAAASQPVAAPSAAPLPAAAPSAAAPLPATQPPAAPPLDVQPLVEPPPAAQPAAPPAAPLAAQPPAAAPQPDLPPAPPGNVIGVFSGRGGVGKSTVVLMLALLAYRRGLRVALVDADLQFGDIAYLFGSNHDSGAETRPLLSLKTEPIDPRLGKDLLVLTAPDSVEQSELLADEVPGIVNRLAEGYQVVLINTSAFWTTTQAQLARTCSRLLFLMDQRTTSIKACQRVLELCVKLQIPEARFSYAINGCHRFAPISTQDASLALGGQPVIGLEDGGTLVDELLSLGCPWELLESGNGFVRSLEKLLEQLLPQGLLANGQAFSLDAQATDAPGLGLFKNLFKRGVRDVA